MATEPTREKGRTRAHAVARSGVAEKAAATLPVTGAGGKVLTEIRQMIESARQRVAAAVNSGLVQLYWGVGERIRREILGNKRAGYGEEIVYALSRQLSEEYGNGFSRPNLFHMIRFAEVYPKPEIVQALSAQLSWTHLRDIIYLEDDLKRDFYAEMCRMERWSTRVLRQKIDGMLFERTAISRKPQEVIRKDLELLREEDRLTADMVFRDPYFLGFLRLKDAYGEKDMEAVILREMESFILELGVGFSFVARQQRITVDQEDYYIDLLFYHRRLRRLVAIDLKMGRFQASDKGQMELYLRWLAEHERQPSEEEPLGLILCAGKSSEHVELLRLEQSGIRVAEYMTELPGRQVLEHKLHEAIVLARHRLQKQGKAKGRTRQTSPVLRSRDAAASSARPRKG